MIENKIDDKGNVTATGELEVTKANHNNMPNRTNSYLSTDERGHIVASSLGGTNSVDNVVPQSRDLNHGSYLAVENAERAALKDGATIESEKIAYVNSRPGDRPTAFMVNDEITYPDGTVKTVNSSFANLTNAEQNAYAKELEGIEMDDSPNPGDTGRELLGEAEYAKLMQETECELPSVTEEYKYTPVKEVGTDSDLNTAVAAETVADTDLVADLD